MEYRISKELEPTFENVSETFLARTLRSFLTSYKTPSLYIKFMENEGFEYAKNVLKKYYDSDSDIYNKIIQSLTPGNYTNDIPVICINDYKRFFSLLTNIYKKDIELFIKNIGIDNFPEFEMHNFLYYIASKMKPEDFNHPEKYLHNQCLMYYDNTLKKYDEEKILGPFEMFNNHIVGITNGISNSWDENARQMEIRIYDKTHFVYDNNIKTPCYLLPFVRYGIYEKDNKKVCCIGSIQNPKSFKKNVKSLYEKKMDRIRYKSNKEVPNELTEKVEPKNIIALAMFINIVNQEGIYDFEVPNLYVLNDILHSRHVDKQDLINEVKCEGIIKTFERLLYHYPNGHIQSYPGELDNMFHVYIPKIEHKNDIRGTLFQNLYKLIDNNHLNKENLDI